MRLPCACPEDFYIYFILYFVLFYFIFWDVCSKGTQAAGEAAAKTAADTAAAAADGLQFPVVVERYVEDLRNERPWISAETNCRCAAAPAWKPTRDLAHTKPNRGFSRDTQIGPP
jgi:hypothetical protein